PPTGALTAEHIDLIKRWIDSGAEWPDALANDVDRPPADPLAIRLAESIRRAGAKQAPPAIAFDPSVLDARAEGGSTPVMFAALYGNAALLQRMLAAGGAAALRSGCRECFDTIAAARPLPRMRNTLATLLPPIAAGRADSVRTAVQHGADLRAVDQKGRSVLMTAAASDTLPAESLH